MEQSSPSLHHKFRLPHEAAPLAARACPSRRQLRGLSLPLSVTVFLPAAASPQPADSTSARLHMQTLLYVHCRCRSAHESGVTGLFGPGRLSVVCCLLSGVCKGASRRRHGNGRERSTLDDAMRCDRPPCFPASLLPCPPPCLRASLLPCLRACVQYEHLERDAHRRSCVSPGRPCRAERCIDTIWYIDTSYIDTCEDMN
jgi:hypothetical protein